MSSLPTNVNNSEEDSLTPLLTGHEGKSNDDGGIYEKPRLLPVTPQKELPVAVHRIISIIFLAGMIGSVLVFLLGIETGLEWTRKRFHSEEPFSWDDITPTPDLKWHPCFHTPGGRLECARLQVPLDWTKENHSHSKDRTVAIALTKVPAAVPESDQWFSGPVLINPGGPGRLGVAFAIELGRDLQAIVGDTHSVIGFDTRGVNNTTPVTTCFRSEAARAIWSARVSGKVFGYSSDGYDLREAYVQAQSIGGACEDSFKSQDGNPDAAAAQFVGTPNVARDMLAIVDATWKPLIGENAAKKRGLRFWGFSYGSALGQTFASMYPDRVERVVIDGVVNIDDYYAGGWRTNLQDADKVIDSFFKYCVSAGPLCPFSAGTPKDVAVQLQDLLLSLDENPIPVYNATDNSPDWVTSSDVRSVVLWSLYSPIQRFPAVAEALAALQYRNATPLAAIIHSTFECQSSQCRNSNGKCSIENPQKPNTGTEADWVILCQDGISGGRGNSTVSQFVDYVNELKSQSELIAGHWARIQMACTGWRLPVLGISPLPSLQWGASRTANPLLIVSSELDPVTPLRNAFATRKRFSGSGILIQKSVGHCSLSAPSQCSFDFIKRYFETGIVDKQDEPEWCEADQVPWGTGVSTEAVMALTQKWNPVVPGGLR